MFHHLDENFFKDWGGGLLNWSWSID